MTLLSKALLGLLALGVAMVASVQTYTFVHFAQEPYIFTEAKVTNSPIPYGDDLIIRYTAERRVLCKTDVDTFILRVPGPVLMYESRQPAGIIPLGTSTMTITVPTIPLQPGQYVVRFFVHSDCGDRLHTIMVPDISFEVVSG